MLEEAVRRHVPFAEDVVAADKWPAMYGTADEMQVVAKRPRLIIDLLTDEMIDGYERKSERT